MPAAQQQLMARLTGHYRQGTERTAADIHAIPSGGFTAPELCACAGASRQVTARRERTRTPLHVNVLPALSSPPRGWIHDEEGGAVQQFEPRSRKRRRRRRRRAPMPRRGSRGAPRPRAHRPVPAGRLRRFYRRFEQPILVAAGALFAVALLVTYAKTRPVPYELTQKDIDAAVVHTLEIGQSAVHGNAGRGSDRALGRAGDGLQPGQGRRRREGRQGRRQGQGRRRREGQGARRTSAPQDKAKPLPKDKLARNDGGKAPEPGADRAAERPRCRQGQGSQGPKDPKDPRPRRTRIPPTARTAAFPAIAARASAPAWSSSTRA